jgi:hypothetical protein
LTHFAAHCAPVGPDAINRYWRGEQLTPRLVWEHGRGHVVQPSGGYVLCDDTVRDKNASCAIELVRHHYSGNAKQGITGSGGVPCVAVTPPRALFWLIADRIYDPDGDGKSKRDHVRDMRTTVVCHQPLAFQAV